MENVMDMVQGPLMGEVFGRISGFFRESPEGVRRGFQSAVPLSMAGLAQRASTQDGAQELLSTFKGGQYPHLDAGELGRAVADPDTAAGVARSGEGFVSRLFGNKQSGIVDGLASSAGVSTSSASKLLGLALPMVMGFVGKQAVARNMDASGLRGFLTSQRRQMGDALPGSLSRLVGGEPEAHAAVTSHRTVVRPEEIRTHRPGIGRYLLLVAAIAAALMLLLSRRGARRQAVNVPSTPQTQPIGDMARPQTLNAGDMTALSQALGGRTALPERFVLSDLTFRTDSAEIDPGSTRVLDGVASALAAHPGARIRVEGHTDNTGTQEANQPLSQARADSTRAYLISKGIGGERIEAVGYGADRPLGSNATQAGRAENRRTELVVLQR
jgi:outer membrane protein OmpA-like peptidoglycan-associated protein